MTKSEKEELTGMLAGFAVPGVIGRASMFDDATVIAQRTYDIARALADVIDVNQEPDED